MSKAREQLELKLEAYNNKVDEEGDPMDLIDDVIGILQGNDLAQVMAEHADMEKRLEHGNKIDAVLDVVYVSVWENDYEIRTAAKYNPATGLIFDIASNESIEGSDDVTILKAEYIILPSGRKLGVNESEGEYWTLTAEEESRLGEIK